MSERAPGTGLTRRWLAGLVAGAAIANVVRTTVLPGAAHFPFNLAVGGAAVGVALGAGLSARELGLRREDLGRGLRYGGAVLGVGVVAVGEQRLVDPSRAPVYILLHHVGDAAKVIGRRGGIIATLHLSLIHI